METYQLYQYDSCPFCYRVRQFLRDAGIDMPMRDTLRDPQARQELLDGGGMEMVPCLRIEREGAVSWLYESMDIIDYLRQRMAQGEQTDRGVQTSHENDSTTRGN